MKIINDTTFTGIEIAGQRVGITHILNMQRFDTQARSSHIHGILYNTESQVLRVRFQNGTEYEYAEVPQPVVTAFVAAESLGKFFNNCIKFNYPTFRLEEV